MTTYHRTGKMFVIGTPDLKGWLSKGTGNSEHDVDAVAERFSEATFFANLAQVRASVKANKAYAQADFGRGLYAQNMFKFWQAAKIFVVPFKIRDVMPKGKPDAKTRRTTRSAK